MLRLRLPRSIVSLGTFVAFGLLAGGGAARIARAGGLSARAASRAIAVAWKGRRLLVLTDGWLTLQGVGDESRLNATRYKVPYPSADDVLVTTDGTVCVRFGRAVDYRLDPATRRWGLIPTALGGEWLMTLLAPDARSQLLCPETSDRAILAPLPTGRPTHVPDVVTIERFVAYSARGTLIALTRTPSPTAQGEVEPHPAERVIEVRDAHTGTLVRTVRLTEMPYCVAVDEVGRQLAWCDEEGVHGLSLDGGRRLDGKGRGGVEIVYVSPGTVIVLGRRLEAYRLGRSEPLWSVDLAGAEAHGLKAGGEPKSVVLVVAGRARAFDAATGREVAVQSRR